MSARMITWALPLVIAGLFFFQSPHGIAAETNLIRNPSFEEINENGVPTHFIFSRYSGNVLPVVDTTIARTGNNSVRITGDGNSRPAIAYQLRDIQGGGTYRVGIWYRHAAEDQGAQVGATLLRLMAFDGTAKINWNLDWIVDPHEGEFQSAGGENLHIYAWRDAPDEWGVLAVTFTIPENVDRISIEPFSFWGKGTVWFDDVFATKLDDD